VFLSLPSILTAENATELELLRADSLELHSHAQDATLDMVIVKNAMEMVLTTEKISHATNVKLVKD
jgi:hypothetical protein